LVGVLVARRGLEQGDLVLHVRYALAEPLELLAPRVCPPKERHLFLLLAQL